MDQRVQSRSRSNVSNDTWLPFPTSNPSLPAQLTKAPAALWPASVFPRSS